MVESVERNAGTAGYGIAGCAAIDLHFRRRRSLTDSCFQRLSKLVRSLFWAAVGLCFMAKYSIVSPVGEKSAIVEKKISRSMPVLAMPHLTGTGAEGREVRRLAS